jgi:chromosome segregation protein
VQAGNRSEVRDRLRGTLARAESGATETRQWIQRREAEIRAAEERREALARSVDEAESGLADLLREEELARSGTEQKRDAYEQDAEQVRTLETQSRGLRIELESQRDEAQQAELGMREMELRLQHLDDGIRDKWSVELANWKVPTPALEAPAPQPPAASASEASPELQGSSDGNDEEDRDARREAREIAELVSLDATQRRARLGDVRKQVEAIGEVNLGAIDEHEELRERFRFLSEQKDDLESSVSQLRDAIGRINRTSRKRFRETFNAVNERFAVNFPRLFRGGKANLGLTESEDVLEAGIEIMAQPPGKRLQSVNLLSGGEKTMTAIALLVSVFQVRPSPFFLLDEVDAALDDANVGRFNEIVKELAEDSQFLLITHNKRTIEVSDILYGVTMEEKGVSKLVAVELH